MKKVYVLTLGCPRNLVDSEVLLGLLSDKGFDIVDTPESSDIAIVNTCGFIEDAKKESIDMILHLADLKKISVIKKLIVTGCLSQRYPEELVKEIGEIDAVFGTSDFVKIPDMIERLITGKNIKEVANNPDFLYDHTFGRKLQTLSHYTYVKIQEGCSNKCSYCVIPDLRGPRRSRPSGSIIEEISILKKEHNIRELLIVGQDTTSYGMDLAGRSLLPELLTRAASVMDDGWIRLLYTHPAHFSDELIDVIAENRNICKYVDLPVQHINDRILKKMNRRITKDGITSLIKRIRARIDNATLRTSIIVGFPGETDKEFDELLEYLQEIRFERLGAFIFSREEGTPAYRYKGQVPDPVKNSRFDRVMALQQEISAENNRKLLNKEITVLVDEADPSDPGQFICRGEMDAPEVDGVAYVRGEGVKPGEFINIRVTGTMEYDLIGDVV
ncbi:MAG: 30S ribosomal protein S12 methylthiotransferase RimO [Candidatus Omnitrophota bacterium]